MLLGSDKGKPSIRGVSYAHISLAKAYPVEWQRFGRLEYPRHSDREKVLLTQRNQAET